MIVTTIAHAKKVIDRICKHDDFTLDTETVAADGYNKSDALIFGRGRVKIWSLCYRGEAYSFPTNRFNPSYPLMDDYAELLQPYVEDPNKVKVFHNANYDINMLWKSTLLKKWPNFYDTMIGAWMANVAVAKGLKIRANYYGRLLGSLYISKKAAAQGYAAVSMEDLASVAPYAEEDVVATDELYQMQTFGFVQRQEIIVYLNADGSRLALKNPYPSGKLVVPSETLTEFKKLWIHYHELPVLKATMRAMRLGFPFNLAKMKKIRKELDRDLEKITRKLYLKAGKKVNLNSGKQLQILFERNGVEMPYKTKKGGVRLDAKALYHMQESSSIVADVLNYRKLIKTQSVYVGKSDDPEKCGLEYFVEKDGRIHCTLGTVSAVTGRFGASLPNLQQIPAQADTYGIRDSFRCPKGCVLVDADYAQLELRVMAVLSKDPEMTRVLSDPEGDIHTNTAKEFGVDRNPTAKQLNFLLLYGGMEYMLAEKLTLEGVPTTVQAAKAYRDRYNEVYCKVHEYREELLKQHYKHGYVKLLTGRRRWLPDINWNNPREVHKVETTISNNIVQGSGQDLLKAAIIRLDPMCINVDEILPTVMQMPIQHSLLLKKYAQRIKQIRRLLQLAKTKWVLQVHDEVLYYCEESAGEEVLNLVTEVMTWHHPFPAITDYTVPMVAEGGTGYTWKQAKSDDHIHHVKVGYKI